MNKKLHLAIIAIIISFTGFSQKLEKIKGSRNVTTELTEVAHFNKVIVGDDFEIKLLQGLGPSIQIEADDNLFDTVDFEVQDGCLKFNKLKRISSSKKFEITVVFKDSLNSIELKDDAEIASSNQLKLEDFTLITNESSKAYLTIKADKVKLTQNDKSKSELNITSKEVTLNLNDNTNLKALINASETLINIPKSANAKIEGDTDKLKVTTNENAKLKTEKLTSKNCELITKGKANVSINVSSKLAIEASNNTETTIYGSPKIDLNIFEDEAVLKKKN